MLSSKQFKYSADIYASLYSNTQKSYQRNRCIFNKHIPVEPARLTKRCRKYVNNLHSWCRCISNLRTHQFSRYCAFQINQQLNWHQFVKHLSSSVYNIVDWTIFSLSSGHGKCGVAVIRVSGAQTKVIMQMMCQHKKPPSPRKAILCSIIDPQENIVIDKGLVIYFPGPHSFTGEDCLELHVHGGPAVVSATLSALHNIPRCRQAEPGEFTKRAFLNNKLDLTEVEGLGDLIHAETESQRRQALRQMGGALSQLYGQWRTNIIKCVADLEAYIDFSEDQDIEEEVIENVRTRVRDLHHTIKGHLNDARKGERLREGVQVAIIGKPNVGKSSLLNMICQRPAAIVTDVAGTTRDVIETSLNIGGYPVLLSDTAGLRLTQDKVEIEGIQRAIKRAQEADIKVLVLDLQDLSSEIPLLSNISFGSYLQEHLVAIGFTGSTSSQSSGRDNTVYDSDKPYDLNQDSTLCINNNSNFFNNTIIILNKSDLLSEDILQTVNSSLGSFSIGHINVRLVNCDEQDLVEVSVRNSLQYTEPVNIGNHPQSIVPVCCISCITGEGLDKLLDLLKTKVASMCGDPLIGHPSLTQARHRAHLMSCLQELDKFKLMLDENDIVLASESLRCGLRDIGKISGKITSEDILDVIFRDFCIGK